MNLGPTLLISASALLAGPDIGMTVTCDDGIPRIQAEQTVHDHEEQKVVVPEWARSRQLVCLD